jgi:hypothetical protein
VSPYISQAKVLRGLIRWAFDTYITDVSGIQYVQNKLYVYPFPRPQLPSYTDI